MLKEDAWENYKKKGECLFLKIDKSIEHLIAKYEKPYVKGEGQSQKTHNQIKQEAKRKNRHLIFDELYSEVQHEELNVNQEKFDGLLSEAKPFTLNNNQIKLVRYLIDTFTNNFKELHGQAKEETIILAFMFYTKKIDEPRLKVSNYRICTRYKLTENVFEIILCRLLLFFMSRSYIRPVRYHGGDHEILVKEGRR